MGLPPFGPEGCPGGAEAWRASLFPDSAQHEVWPGLGKYEPEPLVLHHHQSQKLPRWERELLGQETALSATQSPLRRGAGRVFLPYKKDFGELLYLTAVHGRRSDFLGVRLERTWSTVGKNMHIFN